jgi:predicted nucleic acid-binding protein
VILDASVAAKWFLPNEELDGEAQLIRGLMLEDQLRVAAPSILWSEVAHALVGAVRQKRFDEFEARSVSARFAVVRTVVELSEIDPEEAVHRALSAGVGAYDAQYLTLARRLGQSVITADRRLHERGLAHGYDVVWLGDVALRDGVLVDTPQGYQG